MAYYAEEWQNRQEDQLKIIRGIGCKKFVLILKIGIYPDIILKRSQDLGKVHKERDLFIQASGRKWTQTIEADTLGFVSYFKSLEN